MRCAMADLFNDLLIYIGIGICTCIIGYIIGYQLLMLYYTKRFMTLAQECSDTDSVIPLVDELEKET